MARFVMELDEDQHAALLACMVSARYSFKGKVAYCLIGGFTEAAHAAQKIVDFTETYYKLVKEISDE